ncbi:hypothetical protein D0865_09352 [Hortaea werneckii]|uniref:Uncharacterized protein n=1 Tax=Hortaea werneckii TaxID=91943 RepID=A0A3M7C2P0_HORWE|nr:hypothetical protein D0865_09352 [Hortaea werneckii]
MEMFQVSPQCLPHLLGEPDYWAPGSFARSEPGGEHKSIGRPYNERTSASLLTFPEFFCQHPRWHLNTHDIPLSVYMTYNAYATSLIRNETPSRGGSSKPLIALRPQTPSQKNRKKGDLEAMTVQLHVISQDIDSKTASADMTHMIVRRLESAHQRYRQRRYPDNVCTAVEQTADALQYLSESIEAQRRWVVFNLVTQQDAATSATIAREAKADGNSMKVIAALTMVFLPGTFLSSVFGMSVMEGERRWWLYVALTLPLTVFVLAMWWVWQSFTGAPHHWKSMSWSKRSSVGANLASDEAVEV